MFLVDEQINEIEDSFRFYSTGDRQKDVLNWTNVKREDFFRSYVLLKKFRRRKKE